MEEYKNIVELTPQKQKVLEAKQKVVEQKTYDFPEIQMNKQDIYYTFNYDPTITKILSPYSKIGIVVDGWEYIFVLGGGKISDVRQESVSGSDFVVKTTLTELKGLIQKSKEGDIIGVVKGFLAMDLPTKVKLQLMKNFLA